MKTAMFSKFLSAAALAGSLTACAVAGEEEQLSSTAGPTWEEFRDSTWKETFEDGHYIVNGDIAIRDEKQLYEFWQSLQSGELIVNRVGSQDDRWSDAQKLNLTYCISNNFGANKTAVVNAFNSATANWESRGNVNFVYVPAQDASCTASNNNVLFDVRPVSGQQYLARAFFPSNARSSRNVLIDSSSFGNLGNWELDDIVAHELGHTLGFRHEHTRPEAGTCFEDNSWRALTPYDRASIMHYPQCNGSASQDLEFSSVDTQGITALYGASGGGGPVDPPPTGGTATTDTKSGSVARNQTVQVANYAVVAGTTLTVTMTGTGDPDLYVRWGAAPTTTQFNCRPYLDGASESCTGTVPAGTTRVYVAVRGYTAATYSVRTDYTTP